MEIVQNLFRTLMFFLDNIVYGLIPQIYKLFIYLSQLNLFGGGDSNPLQQLISRVYVLLGIFMLFKVSFSLLQYIVDPNSFRDSSKGVGKLVTNVLVALVLLVSVPSIFSFATEVQARIVQSNVIGELILGSSMSDDSSEMSPERVETMARDVQFMMFGAFYSLNPEVTSGENALFSQCDGTSGVFGSRDMATVNNGGCLEQLRDEIGDYDDASSNGVDLYSFFKYVGTNERDGDPCVDGICDDRDFSHFDKLLWWKSNGNYVINYLPFISTAAGIYIVFLLITFCVDIAVRVIKLCFLQMLAPIAIVSYIDPKESISSGKLNGWIKESVSTYFSLFLRLATIFFVMLLISVFSSIVLASGSSLGQQIRDITGDDIVFNIWIYLFLIIGAFMFAKQVPKIIESIFGIKGSGEFSLNPFKNAGATTLLGGAAGFGLGTVASGVAAAKTSLDNGESGLTTFRRTISGAASGGLKGGISSVAAGGKGFMSKSFNAAGDVARNTAMKANTKAPYRYGAYVRNAIGAQSLKETLDQKVGIYEGIEKAGGGIEARARDQLSKKDDEWKLIQGRRAWNEQQRAMGAISEDEYKNNLNDYFQKEQKRIAQYVNNNGNMGTDALSGDDELVIQKETLARSIKESKLKDGVYGNIYNTTNAADIKWEDIDGSKKKAHLEAYEIKNSDKYEDASNAEKAKLSDLRQSFLNK